MGSVQGCYSIPDESELLQPARVQGVCSCNSSPDRALPQGCKEWLVGLGLPGFCRAEICWLAELPLLWAAETGS